MPSKKAVELRMMQPKIYATVKKKDGSIDKKKTGKAIAFLINPSTEPAKRNEFHGLRLATDVYGFAKKVRDGELINSHYPYKDGKNYGGTRKVARRKKL